MSTRKIAAKSPNYLKQKETAIDRKRTSSLLVAFCLLTVVGSGSVACGDLLNAPGGGKGLIGLVKAGGTVDDSLRSSYVNIAQSPQFAASLDRYNRVARLLGQKSSAGVDDIVGALQNQVTFARTSNIRAGLFTPGQHPGSTQFWVQGNPLTRYGARVGRHELTHLGASLRGQGDTLLHEIAVQAATTPENLVIGGGIIVGAGGAVYYGLHDD